MERKTLESAASRLTYLRGLLAVPAGALMILAALANWELGPLRHEWLFAACIAAAAVLWLRIGRHYDEHYGRITGAKRQRVRGAVAAAGSVALMLGGSLLLRSNAAWSLDLPVNALAAALAAGFLTFIAVSVGLGRHHVVVWGSLLVAALLPIWGGLDLSTTSNVGLVLAGVATMASGVLDHRLLVRSFARPRGLTLKPGDLGA